jgi:hypothetical protein
MDDTTRNTPRLRRPGRIGAAAVAGGLALLAAAGAGAVPVSVSPPTIQGQVRFNETLTCLPGAWSGAPVSFRYDWLRSGSPFAEGQVLRFTDLYTMGGYLLSCRVTAVDAAGAAASADSASQRPGTGRITLTITKVRSLPKGKIRISGRVGPPLMTTAPFGRSDYVVLQRKVSGGVTQLSDLKPVSASGRFTVTGTDTPGRKRIVIRYWSGERDVWGGTEVTRTVRVTRGGNPGSGGSVGIGG